MPPLAGRQHQGSGGFASGRDDRRRRIEDTRLDALALPVEAIKAERDGGCFRRVVGGQEPCAQAGLADAPAGVDPGPEEEAGMIGTRRLLHGGNVGQCPQSGIAAPCHHRQALRHQGPVDAGQGHHVAHRAKGHQVKPLHEIRLGPPLIPAGPA